MAVTPSTWICQSSWLDYIDMAAKFERCCSSIFETMEDMEGAFLHVFSVYWKSLPLMHAVVSLEKS